MYHFGQETQNQNQNQNPLYGGSVTFMGPEAQVQTEVSEHSPGDKAHYITCTSIGVGNLDRLVLGILDSVFFVIYLCNYKYQIKSILYFSLTCAVHMLGK